MLPYRLEDVDEIERPEGVQGAIKHILAWLVAKPEPLHQLYFYLVDGSSQAVIIDQGLPITFPATSKYAGLIVDGVVTAHAAAPAGAKSTLRTALYELLARLAPVAVPSVASVLSKEILSVMCPDHSEATREAVGTAAVMATMLVTSGLDGSAGPSPSTHSKATPLPDPCNGDRDKAVALVTAFLREFDPSMLLQNAIFGGAYKRRDDVTGRIYWAVDARQGTGDVPGTLETKESD